MTAGDGEAEKPAGPGRDVVFIRLRLLGDIVFTIPALQLYRHCFPLHRIHYVVEERFAEVARLIPGVDDVVTVPAGMGAADIWRFRRRMRQLAADTVVDFHSGPTSALLTRVSGAARRVGYRTPNRNWAYNFLVPRHLACGSVHSVANQARLLQPLGVPDDEPPAYPVFGADQLPMPGDLPAPREWRRTVVIHLGAGNLFRDWGEERFRQLVARLLDAGLEAALIGNSGAEVERGGRLAAERPALRDWTGRLGARSMLACIARAAVYVGADSGPLHLASLTATPLVALYGPNVTAVSGPWRRCDVTILERPLECRPCSQRRCRYGTMYACMRDISVESVYEAVVRYIR